MRLSLLFLLAVVLAVAALATLSEASRTYGVTSLSVSDCTVRDDLQSEIGDDRSGMAITPTRLFHLGDTVMVSFNATTLADDVLLPITDGIISDLGDGALWALAFDNSTFLNGNDAEDGTYNITHVIPLTADNATVDASRSVIALSQPLSPYYDASQPVLFVGVRGFVFASGIDDSSPMSGLFYVSLNTGLVTRLYPQDTTNLTDSGWAWPPVSQFYGSENWASWGVMEETQGVITLLATSYNAGNTGPTPAHVARGGSSVTGIYRWAVNGSLLGSVFEGALSDCAAFTVNYFEKASASKRWFAHAEGSDTVIANATNEWVASCPASHFSLCGNGAIDAGEQCDDGNLVNGDGCNDACDNEARPSPSARPEASSSSVLACFVCHHLLSAVLGVAGQQS